MRMLFWLLQVEGEARRQDTSRSACVKRNSVLANLLFVSYRFPRMNRRVHRSRVFLIFVVYERGLIGVVSARGQVSVTTQQKFGFGFKGGVSRGREVWLEY